MKNQKNINGAHEKRTKSILVGYTLENPENPDKIRVSILRDDFDKLPGRLTQDGREIVTLDISKEKLREIIEYTRDVTSVTFEMKKGDF